MNTCCAPERPVLISFRVSNYRSFRDPQEFSLLRERPSAAGGTDLSWNPDVTPVVAVFGANASGKSSLYKAMQFGRSAVVDSYRKWEAGDSIPRMPFVLDAMSIQEPTEIEYEFIASDRLRYQFGFVTDGSEILSEWLYVFKSAHRTTLYERGMNDGEGIRFGSTYRGSRTELRAAIDNRPNALSISVAGQANVEILRPAYRWLTSEVRFYDARAFESEHRAVIRRIGIDDGFRARLSSLLRRADLGVTDIQVVAEEDDEVDVDTMRKIVELTGQKMDDAQFESFRKFTSMKLEMTHSASGSDSPISFPLSWESEGTRALISFASVAFWSLDVGGTLVVDEIDTSLHPLLVRELIALYQDERTNPKQAQLIFTTHDVSLLGRSAVGASVLGRDQVWVVEKDATGASTLIGLSEYRRPRKEENLERSYLSGRFGGVPSVSFLEALLSVEDRSSAVVDGS